MSSRLSLTSHCGLIFEGGSVPPRPFSPFSRSSAYSSIFWRYNRSSAAMRSSFAFSYLYVCTHSVLQTFSDNQKPEPVETESCICRDRSTTQSYVVNVHVCQFSYLEKNLDKIHYWTAVAFTGSAVSRVANVASDGHDNVTGSESPLCSSLSRSKICATSLLFLHRCLAAVRTYARHAHACETFTTDTRYMSV